MTEIDQLRQRLSEVEAEREAERASNTASNLRTEGYWRNVAQRIKETHGCVAADWLVGVAKQMGQLDTLTARCEALEKERHQLAKAIAPTYDTIEDREFFTLDELVVTARNHRELTDERCEALTAERDRLLASQQADQERFDRDLAHYSQGYTEAVTDVTGTMKP